MRVLALLETGAVAQTAPPAPTSPAPSPQPYPQQPYPQQPYPQQPYPQQQPYPYPQQQPYPYPQQQAYPYPQQSYPQQPYPYPQQSYPQQPYAQGIPYRYAPEPTAPPVEPVHRFSATLSVLEPLLFSTYEVAGEIRLGKQAGLALALGVGSISLQKFDKSLPDETAKVWQIGSQVRFYPVGTFEHGMQAGAEFLYLFGSTSATGTIDLGPGVPTPPPGTLTASGTGLKIGAFIGYKLIVPVGFTCDAQVGIGYLSLKGVAHDEAGNSKSAGYKTAVPLANASVGWSF